MTTKAKRCAMMIPGVPFPVPCEALRFKSGRCAEHYRKWRQAREARGIEAREYRAQMIAAGKQNRHGRITPPTIRVSPRVRVYVPKGERKKSAA